MAGQRRAEYVSIAIAPGVLSNTTPRGAKTRVNYMTWDRWKDGNWVRWHKGLPEKQGGWAFIPLTLPSGATGAQYLGLARGLFDWASLDGQFWIVIGTHQKLYLINNGVLWDITPARSSSNLNGGLNIQNGQALLTVTDPGHKANTGDFITLQGTNVTGLYASLTTLDGEYQVTVIDPNTYTIVASAAATSTNTAAGGQFSVTYDISTGLPSNGFLFGYGAGPYGDFTYGTPRPPGFGVPARLRSWSLDNYGQDLVASYSDGEIYYWTRNTGPASRALIIPNAPTGCQRVLVDSQSQFVIALGCSDLTSQFDSMMVRWCNEGDVQTWFPDITNNAGFIILAQGSRLVTGVISKGQNVVFSDTHAYRMVLGGSNTYNFALIGGCKIVGPDAAIDVDGVVYLMAFDNFYVYDGTLQILPCEVWETIFDTNGNTGFPGFNRGQAEKVHAYLVEGKTEVTWLYPSATGSGECDRYVTYNWDDEVWYYGALNRTAMRDVSPAITGAFTNPYGVNGGNIYEHEVGTDAVEPSGTNAIAWFMESVDMTTGGAKSEYTIGGSDARFAVGGSDSGLLVNSMVPDFTYLTGSMMLYLKTKDRPQQPTYTVANKAFSVTDQQVDIRAAGSQIALRFDNLTITNVDPNFGEVSLLIVPGAGLPVKDISTVGNTIANANVTLETGTVQFAGTSALSFNGSSSELSMPITGAGPLDLSTGDFTIEGWFYTTFDFGQDAWFAANSGGTAGQSLQTNQNTNTIWQFFDPNVGSMRTADGAPCSANTWHHIAVVRQGQTFTVYVDGVGGTPYVMAGSNSSIGTGPNFLIGATLAPAWFEGFMQDIRVTKGLARYTGNFAVPNAPFPTSATPQAGLGSSFRMGIWQALATPYGKR